MPRKNTTPAPPSTEGGASLVRINKALSQAGVCSRRAADELIAQGQVTVNGRVPGPGDKVDPATDRIEVRGKPINAAPPADGHDYVLLHKPTQVVTTAKDPQGRKTVLDILPPALKRSRLYPVGRLDFFSEGLLLLTNDGELANRLMHPSHHLPKVYHVTIRGIVPERALQIMRKGMTLAEGERLAPVEASVLRTVAKTTTLELTLHQGINRQIRRMCRDLKFTVLRLARVSQGPLSLGPLKPGQSRPLTADEIRQLKEAVGLA